MGEIIAASVVLATAIIETGFIINKKIKGEI